MRITLDIPAAVAYAWREQAQRHNMAVGTWLRWRTDTLGIAGDEKEAPPLGQRVLQVMDGKPLRAADVPKMATALGVPPKSVIGALGSLCAKRRIKLTDGVYEHL